MIEVGEARVLQCIAFPRDNYLLSVEAPSIAREVTPGQFVMVALRHKSALPSPLLKRALAVYAVGRNHPADLQLLIKVVGDGTRQLTQVRPGDWVELIGPLGQGFRLEKGRDKLNVLLAGGIGIASMYMLAEELLSRGETTHLIYGARNAVDLVGLEDFEDLGVEVTVTTDDGSAGIPGRITQGLAQRLQTWPQRQTVFYVCGPNPMMRAVSELASRHQIPCQISVESKMACGFGVCLGCSIKTRHGYRLACTEGPVFDSNIFLWEETAGEPEQPPHGT